MKRNLIGTLTLVVLSLMLNATGYAQAVAKADVPFAFNVAKKQLPAGRYTVTTSGQGVIIQSEDSGAAVLSLARKELPKNTSPKMIFHYVGNQYFLSQVWGAQGTSGLTLPTTALEKELRMSSEASKAVGQVVVALK